MFILQSLRVFFLKKKINTPKKRRRNNKNFYIENVKCKNQIYIYTFFLKKQ